MAGRIAGRGARRATGDLERALRRALIGVRLLAAVWSALFAVVALAEERITRPGVAVVALVAIAVWAGATAVAARRDRLDATAWVAVELVAGTAAASLPTLTGGPSWQGALPLSAIAVVAWARGPAGAVLAAVLVALASVIRIGAATPGLSDSVGAALIALGGAAAVTWVLRVLRQTDHARVRAEVAARDQAAARARADERAETAARLHDSVLQTLALLRHVPDLDRAQALARRQERQLRSWLAGTDAGEGLRAALHEAVAAIEDDHGIEVEQVLVGDAPAGPQTDALVAILAEALRNVVHHAGVARAHLYVEAGAETLEGSVRDRGTGFDPAQVPADRRGLADSIHDRAVRHGGVAKVRSAPGQGTEVRVRLPRQRPDAAAHPPAARAAAR